MIRRRGEGERAGGETVIVPEAEEWLVDGIVDLMDWLREEGAAEGGEIVIVPEAEEWFVKELLI